MRLDAQFDGTDHVADRYGACGKLVVEIVDVGAAAEESVCARENDGFDLVVGVRGLDRFVQLGAIGKRKRVDRRIIQRN